MKMKDEKENDDTHFGERDLEGGGQNGPAGDRARAGEDNSCESVASQGSGGVPSVPARVERPGQIVEAYQAGRIPVDVMVNNILEGLKAEKAVVMSHSRGSGKDRESWQTVEMVPDWSTRLAWQDHFVQTVEGLPVKRQEIISRKVTTDEELMQMVAKSPAFRESMRKILDKADRLSKNRGDDEASAKSDE